MRFFLDENFPASAREYLETHGHEVFRALEYYPQGTADNVLFQHAQKENAIFLTTDRDFYHTVPFLYTQRTAAVVVITLHQPNRVRILARLQTIIENADFVTNPQAVVLVTDTRILKRI